MNLLYLTKRWIENLMVLYHKCKLTWMVTEPVCFCDSCLMLIKEKVKLAILQWWKMTILEEQFTNFIRKSNRRTMLVLQSQIMNWRFHQVNLIVSLTVLILPVQILILKEMCCRKPCFRNTRRFLKSHIKMSRKKSLLIWKITTK